MFNFGTSAFRILPLFFSMFVLLSASIVFADNSGTSPENQIKSLIAKTYDRPNHKVETTPIIVADGYAIADWIQDKYGGRALLRKNNGKWEIVACGGDAFKDAKVLKGAGIPDSTTQKLLSKLAVAEKSLNPNLVKKFGLYGKQGHSGHAKRHHNQK